MAKQFLDVMDVAEAKAKFREALDLGPLETEWVPLGEALGRVLAQDVRVQNDVPGFDRANVDGYALCAADTFGADEQDPAQLRRNREEIRPGMEPREEVQPGTATYVATGGVIPRGADAMEMIEYIDVEGDEIRVRRPSTPGARISFAGSDLAKGELALPRGTRLTARETGTLAALGEPEVEVYLRPRIAVFSTGDEITAPGEPMRPGFVYDANLRIVSDVLREIGCEPIDFGIVPDDLESLRDRLREGLEHDAVVFSGGTSKGKGDFSLKALSEVGEIICHGVAVKPGKPICLAVAEGKPVAVLPGFPTSAVFTLHEFLLPIFAELSGAPAPRRTRVRARVPQRIPSETGRAEFVLVSLLHGDDGLVAYPLGKGSGSVTTFAHADGFVRVGRHEEYLEAQRVVDVQLLGREVEAADLVVIGSHCVGLDVLLGKLREHGCTSKMIAVGSRGGLRAAERGECDVATSHLCDDAGQYNTPFLPAGSVLEPGYGRMQGVVFREAEPELTTGRMVNRNPGSGTRVLIDELLGDHRPPGYLFQVRSHNAVAAAVAQGRADWGVTIENIAELYGLSFRPLREERYDFVIPENRLERPAVREFLRILRDPATREALVSAGFRP